MLPPPAPRVPSSTESALTSMSGSSSNVVRREGAPSITRLMSEDVPPTSQHSSRVSPIRFPRWALATAPAAGPEKTSRKGCSIARPDSTNVAAESAKLRSPVNCRARRPSLRVCVYGPKISFMKTSITVVDARAYSIASGETAEEIEHGRSPSASRASSSSRCSCRGLTYELSRQIARPSMSQRLKRSNSARACSSSSSISTSPAAVIRSATPRRR